jgi:hypothetical protein
MQLLSFLLLFMNPQQGPETVVLSTSRTRPYVSEVIELKLTIRTLASTLPLELVIPDLSPQETWRFMMNAWLHKPAKQPLGTLPLLFRRSIFYVQPVKQGEYQLSWKMLIRPPLDDQNPILRIGPAQVGLMKSNALVLEVQQPPLQAPTTSTWHLGVGNYRVTASWQPAEVVLGEETTLNLALEGNGALESVAPPPLRTLPGWESDHFLLEQRPAIWLNGRRVYSYQVRPRQLKATVPALFISFFDPERGSTVTQPVALPSLRILAASVSTNASPDSTMADARNHLPEFRRTSIEQHQPSQWAHWLEWLLWVPLACAGIVLIRMVLERLVPHWLEQLRWRLAARQAEAALRQEALSPVDVRHILATYLSTGLDRTLTSDWESLHSQAWQAPRPLEPLLEQLRLMEFGPDDENATKTFHQLSRQLFTRREGLS